MRESLALHRCQRPMGRIRRRLLHTWPANQTSRPIPPSRPFVRQHGLVRGLALGDEGGQRQPVDSCLKGKKVACSKPLGVAPFRKSEPYPLPPARLAACGSDRLSASCRFQFTASVPTTLSKRSRNKPGTASPIRTLRFCATSSSRPWSGTDAWARVSGSCRATWRCATPGANWSRQHPAT
jgi:hypothetical protein